MAQARTGTIPLAQIYLDPNNYRFRDNKNYREVVDDRVADSSIQKRTASFITGKNNENIQDLIASFKKSGFLPVDQIQVVKIAADKYKVIEGNRRITTLKYLEEEYIKGHNIGDLDPSVFNEVPIVFYEENNDTNNIHYKVLMGLKHINGNKRWPLVNQAQLMQDMSDAGMEEDDIIDSLGITKHRLRRSLRALALVKAYKVSDYGDQFQSDMFNVFDATVSSTNIKDWLNWNEDLNKVDNKINQERFFSWISTVEEFFNDKQDEEDQNQNLKNKREPIINTGRDVRELAKFITDEKALRFMEESGSMTEAYLSSDLIGRDKFDTMLNAIESNLNTALNLSSYAEDHHSGKVDNINKKLIGLIASQGLTEILLPKAVKPKVLFEFPSTKHLIDFNVLHYKGISGIEVEKLNKVNLFAGENNVGKTSLLEAIRLLICQNDANNFLAMQQLRGKFPEGKMPPFWVIDNVTQKIEINGNFGFENQTAQITIEPWKEEDETIDSGSYLGSFRFQGEFMGTKNNSNIRLFEKKNDSYDLSAKKLNHLCAIAFYSPFGSYRNSQIYNAHAGSIEKKYLSKVLSFLREAVDKDIEEILLVEKNGLKRFLVQHKKFSEAIDLNQFGDGLQNIFKTIVLFAIAENGIVLIDEIETAIHHSLLIKYTKFIQELAETFNAQVFITSHSGETVEAFVDNDYHNDKISMYHLEEGEEGVICKYVSGEQYKKLNDLRGMDLRG